MSTTQMAGDVPPTAVAGDAARAVFGVAAIFVSTSGGNLCWSVAGLVVFGGERD